MAVFCLLPFGAWVVWGPAAIWLIATGSVGRGLLLAGIGIGLVSAIDNILRPVLLAFGPVGLVLGPVLTAVALALFEAFTAEPTAIRSE